MSSLLPVAVSKILLDKIKISVDPDQTPRSVASDLGLHCLLKSVCLSEYLSKYGNVRSCVSWQGVSCFNLNNNSEQLRPVR